MAGEKTKTAKTGPWYLNNALHMIDEEKNLDHASF
jgi:hypothetical protein